MTYEPNFNDPRVRARCIKSLTWVKCYIGLTPKWLSTREIDKHLGNTSRQPGQWLKARLLINEDPHFNWKTGKCKTYYKNSQGVKELDLLLGNPPVAIAPELEQQLVTGNFEYTEKSDRFWNPLQHYPTRVKRPLLAKYGFRHHYDIKAAAPTLIKQYAVRLGMTKTTPAIDLYLNDRTSIRTRIARECDISEKTAKRIINALFQGAPVSHKPDSGLYNLLEGDHSRITWFKEDTYLLELRKDIKTCWDTIKFSLPVRTITDKNGVERRASLTSKDKSGVYLNLEKEVLTEVKKFLKRTKNKCFTEHDGWSCESAIDLTELRSQIRSKTGYVIELDWEVWE